jgi:small subunit ribosomal protein S20
MRTEIKELRKMISDKNLDQAQLQLKRVYSVIDRTAQKGMIHPNTGARYKSRLSRLFD